MSHHKNLDFKDAAASRFGHSDLVFHLTKETQLIALLSNFLKLYGFLKSVSWSLAELRHNKIVQSPHENYFNVCRQHKEK